MNVVWIVVDCLRRDHLGCYGYGRNTSPHIDRFARECLRFDQAISPHIPTQPAHTTFFTGRDVFDHQVIAQGGAHELQPAISLLPQIMRQAGYFTAAVDNIGRWFEPAFERYEYYPRWNHDGTLPWRNGDEVTGRALSILADLPADRPFFLFLHYWDPHTPYLPPPPFDRMFYTGDERSPEHRSMDPVWQSAWFANYFREWLDGVRDAEFVKAQYDACIAYSDACLARVFNRLEELKLRDDTLVILHADHGEELDDHGCWFDHHGLYDTNVRVPLLIRFPDGTGAGECRPEMVSLLDLAPTVLQALERPELATDLPGVPLTDHGDRWSDDAAGIYLTECTWMRKRGWRTPRWKLIQALEPDIYGKPETELYDLASDPAESRSVAEEHPDVVRRLAKARDAHVERRLRETGRPDPILEQADALRIWQPRFIAGRGS
jgi:arylsulfatase A-like enzyme